jgi:hypothetical protein
MAYKWIAQHGSLNDIILHDVYDRWTDLPRSPINNQERQWINNLYSVVTPVPTHSVTLDHVITPTVAIASNDDKPIEATTLSSKDDTESKKSKESKPNLKICRCGTVRTYIYLIIILH